MRQDGAVLVLQAVTSLHPGTGQTTGIVDLPVQREAHTGFPMVVASGLKGSLRDAAEVGAKWDDAKTALVFGPPTSAAGLGAGALALTDARILAFPVRSLKEVFFWVTCPYVLRRLQVDMRLAGVQGIDLPNVPGGPNVLDVQDEKAVGHQTAIGRQVLEELLLDVTHDTANIAHAIAPLLPEGERATFEKRLLVVPDADFQYFVLHCSQVTARIKLNERKTTTGDGGNLWYEETLPPETIFYTCLLASDRSHGEGSAMKGGEVLALIGDLLKGGFLQVGGGETVGQGWCQVALKKREASQ